MLRSIRRGFLDVRFNTPVSCLSSYSKNSLFCAVGLENFRQSIKLKIVTALETSGRPPRSESFGSSLARLRNSEILVSRRCFSFPTPTMRTDHNPYGAGATSREALSLVTITTVAEKLVFQLLSAFILRGRFKLEISGYGAKNRARLRIEPSNW